MSAAAAAAAAAVPAAATPPAFTDTHGVGLVTGDRVRVWCGADGTHAAGWYHATVGAFTASVWVDYDLAGWREQIAPSQARLRIKLPSSVVSTRKRDARIAAARRRYVANLASRQRRRVESYDRAAATAARVDPRVLRKPYTDRLARDTDFRSHELIAWHIFSGSRKSSSLPAVDRPGIFMMTLDRYFGFRADIPDDWIDFDPWGHMIDFCSYDDGSRVYLPVSINFEPECTQNSTEASSLHGKSRASPLADADAVPAAINSDLAIRVMCEFIMDLRDLGAPTTLYIENPRDSLLWWMPCVRDLLDLDGGDSGPKPFALVDVDLCLHGYPSQKPTSILMSSELDSSWATTCDASIGACGLTVPDGRGRTHAGLKTGGWGIADAWLPPALTHAWLQHWLPLHQACRTADRHYCSIPVEAAQAAQRRWLQRWHNHRQTASAKPATAPAAGEGPPQPSTPSRPPRVQQKCASCDGPGKNLHHASGARLCDHCLAVVSSLSGHRR